MTKKILHLNLYKEHFDQVLADIKKEEYRKVKEYWVRRLISFDGKNFDPDSFSMDEFVCDLSNPTNRHKDLEELMDYFGASFIPYTHTIFSNGMRKDRPQMLVEFNGVDISTGKTEWGAEKDVLCFNIKLGEIVERVRC